MQQCFIERVYVFHISEYSSYDLLFVYQFGTVDFSLGRDGEGWGGERTGSVHQEAEFWVYSDSQSIFFFLSSHNNLPTSIKSWESDVLEFFTGQQVVVFNNLKSIECGGRPCFVCVAVSIPPCLELFGDSVAIYSFGKIVTNFTITTQMTINRKLSI